MSLIWSEGPSKSPVALTERQTYMVTGLLESLPCRVCGAHAEFLSPDGLVCVEHALVAAVQHGILPSRIRRSRRANLTQSLSLSPEQRNDEES